MRILLAAVLALAGAGLAVAQDGTNAVPDGDDSPSQVDIASVRATYERSTDRLVHIIRFHAGVAPSNFRDAVDEHGPPGSVCINIWTRRTPWEASPNFDVCVSADRGADKLVASVSRLGSRGGVRRRGSASAELTSNRRLVVRFDPDRIRTPAAYRWSAEVTTFERGCTSRGCKDFAPKRGSSVRSAVSP